MNKFDVIVVGAGATGLSSAYHIKRENKDISLAVVERAHTFAQGNTGRAAAGFRDLFSSDVNFKLSHSSIDFYSHVQKDLKRDMGMFYTGYLLLLEESGMDDPALEKLMKKTRARIIENGDLDSTGYFNLNPISDDARLMNAKPIGGAFMGENCGIIEPDLVSQFYYDDLEKMGAEFHFDTEVKKLSLEPVNPLDFPGEPFLWQKKKIGKIITGRGEMSADNYVFATDVWTTELLDPLGIDSHIRPKKRQIFRAGGQEVERMLNDSCFNDSGMFPFTILPGTGIYLRPAPREKAFRVSVADEIGRNFSFTENPETEDDFYNYNVRPTVQEYLPTFKTSKLIGGWAGHYSYNTIDMHPYIFRELNLTVATGTSGSGVMKADADGRVAASLFAGREKVKLYDGSTIGSSDLGISERKVERERFVI